MSEAFDFNKALAALQNGQDLISKDGILTPVDQTTNGGGSQPRRSICSFITPKSPV